MDQEYIPLHLKYKPQKFKNIIGQSNATEYLQQTIREKKMAYAYLFAGQQGIGKTTLAHIMAKAVNCTNLENIPCNTCKNCINTNLGRSLDFHEIYATKYTKSETILEILETIKFAPLISKYKICLIQEADMLSNNVFSSLLKTLTSPPKNTIFILLTTSLNKIPDILVSKCQTIYFQPIKKEDLMIAINKIINHEKLKITNKCIKNLLHISNGSFGNLLNKIEIFSIEKRNITEQSLNKKYGLPSLSILEILIEKILTLNLLKALIIVEYIQIDNCNKEYIINFIYDSLLKIYNEKKNVSCRNKYLLFNRHILIALLKLLMDSKINSNSNLKSNLIYFLLKNDHKRIKQLHIERRKKRILFIPKQKIYSN